ncbi:MAG: deoxyribodipyrimidine photo-lyase, partial [Sediminibacterium sp.]|nr:deoxyribodipyrimidine photo-lyase [Sediminibacterium sp.]
MSTSIRIMWFRRDLRLFDNAALFEALSSTEPVLPVFIFDRLILDQLEDKKDRRVHFIHHALEAMQEALVKLGSSLEVYQGTPKQIFAQLIKKYKVTGVYTNHDYEPYAIERDTAIAEMLQSEGIAFTTCKDQVIFEKLEVAKDDGTPYTVFTPYANKWRATLQKTGIPSFPAEKKWNQFFRQQEMPVISLNDYPTVPTNQNITVTATVNEGQLETNTATFTDNGSFVFKAKDAAGNITEKTVTITNIDLIPPVITINAFDNVNISATDIVVSALTNEGTLNTDSYTFLRNGSYTFIATDPAGNVSSQVVTVGNIVKPVLLNYDSEHI